MNIVKSLASPLRGRGYRWKLTALGRMIVPARRYSRRKLDVYWLSTGRCGTHFCHNAVKDASNIYALHDSGFIVEDAYKAAAIWKNRPEEFWKLKLESFRGALTKTRENMKYPSEVFTELLHVIYPFGYMMWNYYQQLGHNHRLKLIHLVRNPIPCCRSMLKVERQENGGNNFKPRPPALVSGTTSAEKAANVWININTLSHQIVERIDNPAVARIVRIEDLDADGIASLYDFMELDGFDRRRTEDLLNSKEPSVRSSHLKRKEVKTVDATDQELATIAEMTKPLARQLGYDT